MGRYYRGPPSDHFDGERFFNPGHETDRSLADLLRWRLTGTRAAWPETYLSPFAGAVPPPRVDGLRVTLIGHASMLVQMAGQNLLIDPVFSDRASPVRWAGPKRVNPPGVALVDLPPIDAVLITHNHYDHLDLDSLRALDAAHHPRLIAPLGNDAVIHGGGFSPSVETLDWGQGTTLGPIALHLVPALHWSARGVRDRRCALWGGFVLQAAGLTLYHAGDTSYGDGAHFRAVREQHGAPDLALLPIGAYEPRWFMRGQHMNPADAVQACIDCEARQAAGFHWGTFCLTDEAIDAPADALRLAMAETDLLPDRFRALRPGEVMTLERSGQG